MTVISMGNLCGMEQASKQVENRYCSKLAYQLCKAIEQNNLEETRNLIQRGANPNIISNIRMGEEDAAIHYAAKNNNVEIITCLYSAGADLDQCSKLGVTALYLAALKNNLEVVKTLVELGADPNVGIPNEKPLRVAASQGHTAIIKYLVNLPTININIEDNAHYTPLWYAAFNGHLDAVKILVEEGCAIINIKGIEGTAIDAAKRRGHTEVVRYLQEKSSK